MPSKVDLQPHGNQEMRGTYFGIIVLQKMLCRRRHCRLRFLSYQKSYGAYLWPGRCPKDYFGFNTKHFWEGRRSCVEFVLQKRLRKSVTYNKQMKSGLILILAAILFLATSEFIDLPVDENSGQKPGRTLFSWKWGAQESVEQTAKSAFSEEGSLQWPSYKLRWIQDSPYVNKFSVKGNTVKKTSKNERFQILVTPLPCFTKTKASFKVNSYGGKDEGFFIGLITEKRFSEKESQGVYDDTCALFTTPKEKQGNIYMNGNEVEAWSEDWYVPEGKVLDVETDLSTGYVTFYNRETGASKRVALPNSFYGVNVYLFVNAFHTNASFDLL